MYVSTTRKLASVSFTYASNQKDSPTIEIKADRKRQRIITFDKRVWF